MIFWLCKIVSLLAVLILAVGTGEETVTPGYDYGEDSCIELMPVQMRNVRSQAVQDAPFRATFMYKNEATNTYQPNYEYRVVISSDREEDNFMGFIANMRLASDPNVIVGTVIESPGASTSVKIMNCHGTANTATQMRVTQHYTVEFIWVAPENLNETVILRFGVFKNHTLFWNNLCTSCIVPVGDTINLFPSICNTIASSSGISTTILLPSSSSELSMDFVSAQTQSSSSVFVSSSTDLQSKSLVKTKSSSMQSSVVPSLPSSSVLHSTQLHSRILPTHSVSIVSHPTLIKSSKHTSTQSILFLSTALTSVNITLPTSLIITKSVRVSSFVSTAIIFSTTNTATTPTTTMITTSRSTNIPSVLSTAAITDNNDGSLLENTSEMITIGIAVSFVLLIIILQIVIVTIGCIYRRRRKKTHSRSSSFRTLYSLDTASVRSESIRRSNRLYSRENCQLDLKLNIIEVDDCTNSSSVPCNHTDRTCQPSSSSAPSSVEVDVHSSDHQ